MKCLQKEMKVGNELTRIFFNGVSSTKDEDEKRSKTVTARGQKDTLGKSGYVVTRDSAGRSDQHRRNSDRRQVVKASPEIICFAVPT